MATKETMKLINWETLANQAPAVSAEIARLAADPAVGEQIGQAVEAWANDNVRKVSAKAGQSTKSNTASFAVSVKSARCIPGMLYWFCIKELELREQGVEIESVKLPPYVARWISGLKPVAP